MSTKTSFKRIALVVASALAIAGFSAVPANALGNTSGVVTLGAPANGGTDTVAGSTTFPITISGVTGSGNADNVVVTLSAVTLGGAASFGALTQTATQVTNTSPNTSASILARVITVDVPSSNGATWDYEGTVVLNYPNTTTTVSAAVTSGFTTTVTPSGGFSVTVAPNTLSNGGKSPLTPIVSSAGLDTRSTYQGGSDAVGNAPAYALYKQTAGAGNYVEFTMDPTLDPLDSTYSITNVGGAFLSSAPASAICDTSGIAAVGAASVTLSGSTINIGTGSITGADLADDTITPCSGNFISQKNLNVKVSTATVGTQTVTVSRTSTYAGVVLAPVVLQVISIVAIASTASSDVFAYASTTLRSDAGWKGGDGVVYASKANGVQVAHIDISLFQANGTTPIQSYINFPSVAVTLTGVGSLAPTTGGVSSAYQYLPAQTANTLAVRIYSDGRAGTASINIAVNGNVVKTRTVKFYGDPTAISTTPIYSIVKDKGGTAGGVHSYANCAAYDAGTTTDVRKSADAIGTDCPADAITPAEIAAGDNDPAVAVVVTDANGTIIPTAPGQVSVSSSDSTVILPTLGTGAFIDSGLGAFAVGTGLIHTYLKSGSSAASGSKATLTYSVINPSTGAIISSTPLALTIGGAVDKEVISTDASSYEPGAPMVLTVTAKDASGNPVADGTAAPALTSSRLLGNGVNISLDPYVGGKTSTAAGALYAPATEGDFLISGTGTDAAKTKISATGVVNASPASANASLALDAANAATDAANNAYDEAQNATQAASDALAAVTALAAQVKSLIAMVKKLTKAVAKMNKKK